MSIALGLTLALALQEPAPTPPAVPETPEVVEQDARPSDEAVPARATMEALGWSDHVEPQEVGALLIEVAARYPEQAGVELLASGEGREAVTMLVLGDRTGPDPGTRPALCLYSASGPGQAVALAFVAELLEGAGDSRSLLRSATVYVIPALTPGLTDGVDWHMNFPLGWRPASVAPGSGHLPLSTPQARALANFLLAHGNVSLLIEAGRYACGGAELTDLRGPGDQDAWDRFFATKSFPLAGLGPQSLCPGQAGTFAWGAFGVFPARLGLSDGTQDLDQQAVRMRRVTRALREAVARLPRLAVGDVRIEVLSAGLFRLDLSLTNGGALPTLSQIGARRRLAGEVSLALSGGKVLACAAGLSPETLSVQRDRDGWFDVGQIPGRGALALRLLVEAEAGSELTLTCASPRAGVSATTLTLE